MLFGLIAIILPLWTFYMHGGPIYLPLASVYGYFGFSNYFAPASIVTTLSNVMPLFVVLGLFAKVFDKISDGFERLD